MPTAATSAPVVAICDIEDLSWSAVRPELREGHLIIPARSNWVLAVIPHGSERVVQFPALPEVRPGEAFTIVPETLAGPTAPAPIEVAAPGLCVGPRGGSSMRTHIGMTVHIRVPGDALPGWYNIHVRGNHVLGGRRLLHVLPGGAPNVP